MKYIVLSDLPQSGSLPARLRLRSDFAAAQAAGLAAALSRNEHIISASANRITGSVVVSYDGDCRAAVTAAIAAINTADLPNSDERDGGLEFRKRIYAKAAAHFGRKWLLPPFIRIPVDVWHGLRFVKNALVSLGRGRVGVDVLDGAAITASMLRREWSTASSLMFLLGLSELLEEHTRKQARGALAQSLVLNIDTVWVRRGGSEVQIPLAELAVGDGAVVRTGTLIPADGAVLSGEAAVNQSSLTGESEAVFKRAGDTVFAGTVVEEGSLVVEVRSAAAESRVARIVRLIDESDALKADVQHRAERLADRIVPFNFLLAGGAYLLGGAAAAMSALLVDYSCAVKLSTPIAVLSAMREASAHKILVKGGRFLEVAAEADVVVFDKTGTLTAACPEVAYVGAFGAYTRDGVLRTAACIEEHFPHSLARAVVRKAKNENLNHEEEHADVHYIAAHGVATEYDGKRVVIGSRHFVEDDERVLITPEQSAEIERHTGSVLYLGSDGRLIGYLCISDPPRDEASAVIASLKALGIRRVIMLTGDGENAARAASELLGVDEYRAGLLPEDKLRIIEQLKADGGKVMMVGDGINDSPALAAADVSVAMRDAADLARESADVTLLGGDLTGLFTLRLLGMRLLARIHNNFGVIIGVNSALLALGLAGILPASALSLLHNASTTAVSASSTRLLLTE
ncbi:MAG: heavy metal translocating P-type ATPase [Oscillospiraceae bacterium]|jgi:heavy metal translocating P-type ATPase|nr:heavy metal translocating P-type ATPase [Oscillospiraceae bacterium]